MGKDENTLRNRHQTIDAQRRPKKKRKMKRTYNKNSISLLVFATARAIWYFVNSIFIISIREQPNFTPKKIPRVVQLPGCYFFLFISLLCCS